MENSATAAHFTEQWGPREDFKSFLTANPEALKVNPNQQLPWRDLLARIRTEAAARDVSLYEGGCGWGDLLHEISAAPVPAHLSYTGADIQKNVLNFELPPFAKVLLWDITQPLPGDRTFDFIVCRSVIHHTPDPAATFRVFCEQLKPGGTIAVSAYARKTPMREAIDDAMRTAIVPINYEEALALANQFTRLGRDLQACPGTIVITQDLPFLDIKAGTYKVQAFIYNHFIKCWHNELYPESKCDHVNCDWYHPPYAYRYTPEDLRQWAADNGLSTVREASTEAQHYLECIKPA